MPFRLTQVTFRSRNDNGSETTATWRQTQGTNDSVNVDTNFRLRFLLDEVGSVAWTNKTFNLRYQKNGAGGYIAVGAGQPVIFSLSNNFVQGADTTSQLTGGSGSFLTDNNGMCESAGATNSGAAGQFFEAEFCIQLVGSANNTGDYFDFRIYDGTSAIYGYTVTPRITAIKPTSTKTNKPAYVRGGSTTKSSVLAYVSGQTAGTSVKTNLHLYLSGKQTDKSSLHAYLEGIIPKLAVSYAKVKWPPRRGVKNHSSIPCYLEGAEAGTFVKDNQPVFTKGQDTGKDNQPAYLEGVTAGGTASDSQPAFTHGSQTGGSTLPAFTRGSAGTLANLPAFTAGTAQGVSNLPSYVRGQDTGLTSQPVYLLGGALSQSNLSSYTKGQANTLSNLPAYVEGGTGTAKSSTPAYLAGQASGQSQLSAFAAGAGGALDNQPVFVKGQDSSQDNLPAYLAGASTAQASLSSFTLGGIVSSSGLAAYLQGVAPITTNLHAYVEGQAGTSKDNQPAFVKGQASQRGSLDAYTAGYDVVKSNLAAYLAGQFDAKSDVDAYLAGKATGLTNQPVFTAGGLSATSAISAMCAGSAVGISSIHAYLNGFSANVTNLPAYTKGQDTSKAALPAYLNGAQATTTSLPVWLYGDYDRLLPDGDISQSGGWVNESEGSELWSHIDDPIPDDSDFVKEAVTAGDYFEVSLQDEAAFQSGTFSLDWRIRRVSGSQTVVLKIELRAGASVIVEDSHTLTDEFVTWSHDLTTEEIAAIPNFTDLRLRVTVVSVT